MSKKKNIYLIKISFLVVIFLFSAGLVRAVDCPHGFVNDPAPGACGLYTDNNNDDICDLSEIEKIAKTVSIESSEDLKDLVTGQELKTMTVQEAADLYEIDSALLAEQISDAINARVEINDSFQLMHDNYGLSPDLVKDMIVAIKTGQSSTDKKITENTTDYYMWQITLVLTVIYFLSLWLVRKKYISASKNYKIWNFLLLITFIITAITSVFVLLRLNYGITFWFPLNLIYWHVQIGYIMLLISIYHTFWHIPYYKSFFEKK